MASMPRSPNRAIAVARSRTQIISQRSVGSASATPIFAAVAGSLPTTRTLLALLLIAGCDATAQGCSGLCVTAHRAKHRFGVPSLPEATGELWVPIESLVGLDVKGGERAE